MTSDLYKLLALLILAGSGVAALLLKDGSIATFLFGAAAGFVSHASIRGNDTVGAATVTEEKKYE